MKKYKVFLCEPVHPAAYARLEEFAEIISDESRLCEVDAAVNRNIHMDRAWLDRCPKLKVIGVHGTGTDDVDMAAAMERGIKVVNTPGVNAESVSELIAAFALSMSRNIPGLDRAVQSGARCTVGGAIPGIELRGRVFGTVGTGKIAAGALRILAGGLGMKAIGYSPSLTGEKAEMLGMERCASVSEVFERADVISISIPLNDETRGLVNAELLSRAKQGAIFINTSRGAIVDEAALYDALTSGRLAAAACDVFVSEPPTVENPLVKLPNFLATPHIGANTDDALRRVGMQTAEQIYAVLEGKA